MINHTSAAASVTAGRQPSDGTTLGGGAFGYGTVFQLTPSETLTVLHSFTDGSDGAYPEAGVIADAAGNLLRHDLLRQCHCELRWGLRHGVRADGAGKFYRGRARRNMNTKRLGQGRPQRGL